MRNKTLTRRISTLLFVHGPSFVMMGFAGFGAAWGILGALTFNNTELGDFCAIFGYVFGAMVFVQVFEIVSFETRYPY